MKLVNYFCSSNAANRQTNKQYPSHNPALEEITNLNEQHTEYFAHAQTLSLPLKHTRDSTFFVSVKHGRRQTPRWQQQTISRQPAMAARRRCSNSTVWNIHRL